MDSVKQNLQGIHAWLFYIWLDLRIEKSEFIELGVREDEKWFPEIPWNRESMKLKVFRAKELRNKRLRYREISKQKSI